MRRLIAIGTLAAILAGGTGAVRAAAPTLGATVGTLAGWPYVRLVDVSTLPETFTLSPPDGWQFARLTATLGPGEQRDIHVTRLGPDGTLAVHVAPAVPVAGTEHSALVLQAELQAHAPLPVPWIVLALIGLCAVLAVRPAVRLFRRG